MRPSGHSIEYLILLIQNDKQQARVIEVGTYHNNTRTVHWQQARPPGIPVLTEKFPRQL